jgi:hypothetical protein
MTRTIAVRAYVVASTGIPLAVEPVNPPFGELLLSLIEGHGTPFCPIWDGSDDDLHVANDAPRHRVLATTGEPVVVDEASDEQVALAVAEQGTVNVFGPRIGAVTEHFGTDEEGVPPQTVVATVTTNVTETGVVLESTLAGVSVVGVVIGGHDVPLSVPYGTVVVEC